MTKQEYFDHLSKVFQTGLNLMKLKNADYAGDEDPFKNFHLCEQLGIPLEQGIMVRMSDKLARASNLLKNEAKVSTESIQDTLVDLMNYSAILMVWLEDKSLYKEKIQKLKSHLRPTMLSSHDSKGGAGGNGYKK